MRGNQFARIWLVTAVLMFAIEGAMGQLMKPSMDNNELVPWQPVGGHAVALFAAASVLAALAFTSIFLKIYRGGGWAAGARFGLWVTLLASVGNALALAALLPIGRRIPVEMIGADLVTLVVCGAAAGALAGAGSAAATARA